MNLGMDSKMDLGMYSEVNLEKALEIQEYMPQPERHDLLWLARAAEGCKSIVELGCLYGASTRAMLDNSDARIWCIDSWRGSDTTPKRGHVSTEEDFLVFLRNIQDVRDRVVILKTFTREAAGLLPRGSFDMVFIDADHSYDAVRFDILHYAPLLRFGGLLCGHDYKIGWRIRGGLIRAVNELVTDVHTAGQMIWWTRKKKGWLREEPKIASSDFSFGSID